MHTPADWMEADWPAPAPVRTLLTTRRGGVSAPPFDSMNLGLHVGDDPVAVDEPPRSVLQKDIAIVGIGGIGNLLDGPGDPNAMAIGPERSGKSQVLPRGERPGAWTGSIHGIIRA